MVDNKEECQEFTTFVSLVIGGVCLFVSFFFVVGLMMAVIAISFTLPLYIF